MNWHTKHEMHVSDCQRIGPLHTCTVSGMAMIWLHHVWMWRMLMGDLVCFKASWLRGVVYAVL